MYYECENEPSHIFNVNSHGNNKSGKEPFRQVKPSTRKLLRRQSSFTTPTETLQIVRENVGGQSAYSTDLPRNSKQVKYERRKNPQATVRGSSGGKPAANRLADVHRIMETYNSFVLEERRIPPQKTDDHPHYCWVLGDRRALRLVKDFGLKGSLPPRLLKVDMTYGMSPGFFLTTVHIRHPFIGNIDTGNEIMVPVIFLISNDRTQPAYQFLAEMVVKYAGLKSDDIVFGWVR